MDRETAPRGKRPLKASARAALTLALLLLSGCSPGYLLHLAGGQLRILWNREPVARVLESEDLSEEQRRKIRLGLEAKAFGEQVLGLEASGNYTLYYHVEHPPIVTVLTACPKLALEPYSWWFPIVGRVPYKGYFDPERARRDERALVAEGYDTHLRGAQAWSSLGWFRDPIFSSMLRLDDATLVEIILHEMVHGTIYLNGQGTFNEGVAVFVGEKGTEAFFAGPGEAGPAFLEALRERWAARRAYRERMKELAERLRSLYASERPDAEKLQVREQVFREAKGTLAESWTPVERRRYAGVLRAEWNNAFLVSFLVYRRDHELWQRVYDCTGRDLPALVERLGELRDVDRPYARLGSWLAGCPEDATGPPEN